MSELSSRFSRLRRERWVRVSRVASQLLADRPAETTDDVKWLEAEAAVRELWDARARSRRATLLAALLLALVSASYCVKYPAVNASLQVLVDGGDIRLQSQPVGLDLPHSQIRAKTLEVDHVRFFGDTPRLRDSSTSDRQAPLPDTVRLVGTSVQLKDVRLFPATVPVLLAFDQQANRTDISVNGTAVSARIAVEGATSVRSAADDAADWVRNARTRPVLRFFLETAPAGQNEVPLRLSLEGDVQLDLQGLPVQRLDCVRIDPLRPALVSSTLLSGKVRLIEQDKELVLKPGDLLSVGFTRCSRSRVTVVGDQIAIAIDGQVDTLLGGLPESRLDYMPSLLEFFYGHRRIALGWTAFFALWGAVWAFRRS